MVRQAYRKGLLGALLLAALWAASGARAKEFVVWMKIRPNDTGPADSCYEALGPESHDQEWLRVRLWPFNPARGDTLLMSVNVDGVEMWDSVGVAFDFTPGTMGEGQFWIADTTGVNESCPANFVFAVKDSGPGG